MQQSLDANVVSRIAVLILLVMPGITGQGCNELRCSGLPNAQCTETEYCADVLELHEVTCCADTAGTGFEQRYPSTCPDVWGEADTNGQACAHALNVADAVVHCSAMGGRLCTADELERDCTRDTGCGHNWDLVWSSTDDASQADFPQNQNDGKLTHTLGHLW
jgi:hypothetical protein